MNLKRATWIALVMYISSFIVGLIPLFFMGINTTNMDELPANFFIIGVIISIVLAGLFSLLYFKDKKIQRNAKEGFYFGLAIIVMSFILEMIISLIFSLMVPNIPDMFSYYSTPAFWISLVLVIATATLVGKFKSKK